MEYTSNRHSPEELLYALRRLVAEAARIYGEDPLVQPLSDVRIDGPAAVHKLLGAEMASLTQEQLRTVTLSTKNQVLSAPLVYQGQVAGIDVRAAEVFRPAVLVNAAAIIVVHNHPSGDPNPSPEALHITRQLAKAGKVLDVDLLDHVIIGRDRFVSLRERGFF